MNTKSKLTYGTVEVDDEDFRPSNVRRRISIMIPEDVIAKLTAMGAKTGDGYQTVINRLLREAVSEPEPAKLDRESDIIVADTVKATMKKIEEFTKKRIEAYLHSRLTLDSPKRRGQPGKKASPALRIKG